MTTRDRLRRARVTLRLACCAALLSCATPPPPVTTPPRVPAVTIVILTSQGVTPGKDSAGLNDFILGVTKAFSKALEAALAPLGKQTKVVVNQDPTVAASDVLVRSATFGQTDAVIQLGIASEQAASGKYTLSVVVHFLPLAYSEQGGHRAVIPRDGTRRTIPLTKPEGGGWRDEPVSELVRPFVEALKASGEI
jgi:hypothetical protein